MKKRPLNRQPAPDELLTGWKFIMTLIAMAIVSCVMWWAVITYICIPAAHAIGGLFRMGAMR